MNGENQVRTLKTVETSAKVLWTLKEMDGATVTQIANELDVSKGAAYNHLATLKDQRMLEQEGDIYRLGLKFVVLGEYVKRHMQLYTAARDETDNLADDTDECIHLMVEEHGEGIQIYNARGENTVVQPYHDRNLANPDHLHYGSAGKAILAFLPDERVDRIIEEKGLPRKTQHTITDRERLFEELETIRERGYAINDEEEVIGLRAVGAPIRNSNGEVVGSVSVSGPNSRLKGDLLESELPERVMEAANIIQLNLETATNS